MSDTPRTGEAVLSEIQQWIWHLDLHVTEHDLTHAGKALRAAWPQVRKHFVDLEKEQKALIADLSISMRDHFAAHFLERAQSLCETNEGWNMETAAQCAYAMADAMLKERAK